MRARRLGHVLATLLFASARVGAQGPAAAAPAATPAPGPTLATGAVHPEAARLIDQVMSPFCPGLILTNCPTLAADSLRRSIRERFAAGASREQVLRELYRTYGNVISAAPDQSGFGLLAWLAPGVSVLIGGILITIFIRRRRPPPAVIAPAVAAAPPTAADSALDAALTARLKDG